MNIEKLTGLPTKCRPSPGDGITLETRGPVIQRQLDNIFPVLHRRVNAPFAWWQEVRMPSEWALDRALDALQLATGPRR